MRALVLGGTGFIGSAVVEALAARGATTTVLVHQRRPDTGAAEIVEGSIATYPWESFAPAPDVVIDCGRIPGGSLRARGAKRLASERLLRWTRRAKPRPFYVFVSGTLMYGSHGEAWVSENTPLHPFAFARSNVAAETPWQRAVDAGEPVAIVRPPWVYGPGSWLESFYREPHRTSGSVPQYGHGQQWLTLMSRTDCARMIVELAMGRDPGVWNLVTHPPLRQIEFQQLLCEAWDAQPVHMLFSSIEKQYGKSLAEALTFSARVKTVRPERWHDYRPAYSSLRDGLSDAYVIPAKAGIQESVPGFPTLGSGFPLPRE